MNTSVISGEAAETDSDEEYQDADKKHKFSKIQIANVPGEIINGEDSESDTASNDDVESKQSENIDTVCNNKKVHVKKFDSLLHKKLIENNGMLCKNMHNFLTTKTNEATTSLNNTDRQLMKSQLTLQTALNSMRLLNMNSLAIKNKLKNIVVDDNYLHNLAIMQNK